MQIDLHFYIGAWRRIQELKRKVKELYNVFQHMEFSSKESPNNEELECYPP